MNTFDGLLNIMIWPYGYMRRGTVRLLGSMIFWRLPPNRGARRGVSHRHPLVCMTLPAGRSRARRRTS